MGKNMEAGNVVNTNSSEQLNAIFQFVAGIIESRYPDLNAHLLRIKNRATLFAQYASLSEEETLLLSVGAGVHDIGKLSISDYILNKPAKLTASEYTLVQKHVDFGAKFLEPLKLDVRINEIVLFHHENYDGSGYPDRMIGDEIPLLARMTRILDSFDALTEDRPYHRGVGCHEAIELLHRESHLYDPHLLQCFCKMIYSLDNQQNKDNNLSKFDSIEV